jgi:Domain of unknown function (DUF1707)
VAVGVVEDVLRASPESWNSVGSMPRPAIASAVASRSATVMVTSALPAFGVFCQRSNQRCSLTDPTDAASDHPRSRRATGDEILVPATRTRANHRKRLRHRVSPGPAILPRVAGGDVRVGDRERDEVARLLREHCAVGRISLDEFDERVGAVYRARTREQLELLLADLPDASPAATARSTRRFWLGVKAFHEERRLSASCRATYAAALREMVPRMGMRGFHLRDEIEPRRLQFVNPEGLTVTVLFFPSRDGGTIVSAFGHAGGAVRKAFAELRD